MQSLGHIPSLALLAILPLLLVALCAATGTPARAAAKEKVLFAADFETNANGFIAVGDNYTTVGRTAEKAHGGTYCMNANGATWMSPLFPVTPYQFYKLSFYSQLSLPAAAPGAYAWGGHWAAYFYDANGNLLPDHYGYIDGSADWARHECFIRAKVDAAYCSIRFHSQKADTLYVDDVKVTAITAREAAAWADAYYATLPPVHYTAPADRWQHLPRTMERLRKGGKLRIVMLGDSIINDTGTPPYDALLMRLYPKAKIEVVTSVRGSTGCWFYKEPGNVQQYVLRHHPDLVIIGGISNVRNSTEAQAVEHIRTVIQQIRAQSNPEFLLLTGAVSQNGYHPTKTAGWTATVDPAGTGYRSLLLQMAAEENADFLDMAGAWGSYMLEAMNAGKAYEWFQRDPIHANERGKQILARILTAYFAPNP